MLQWAHLDNTNYRVILVISWAVSLLLFISLAQAVRRLSQGLDRYERSSFVVALLLSPLMGGIVIETTGDPMQLILAIYLLLLRFVVEARKPALVTGIAFAAFGAIAALIHEASLFFLAPALVVAALVLLRTLTARAALLGYLLGALPVVLAIILTNHHRIAQDFVPPVHLGSQVLDSGSQGFDTFSSLFHGENAQRFGRGLRGYVALAANTVGDSLLPLFFAFQIITVFFNRNLSTRETRQRVLLAFLVPVLLSGPLYLIAHDWGRFLAYGFILTLATLAGWRTPHTIKPSDARQAVFAAGLLLAGLTTTPLLNGYRVRGLRDNPKILLCSILIMAVATYLLHHLRPEKLAESPEL